jgi:hypothetical protein
VRVCVRSAYWIGNGVAVNVQAMDPNTTTLEYAVLTDNQLDKHMFHTQHTVINMIHTAFCMLLQRRHRCCSRLIGSITDRFLSGDSTFRIITYSQV